MHCLSKRLWEAVSGTHLLEGSKFAKASRKSSREAVSMGGSPSSSAFMLDWLVSAGDSIENDVVCNALLGEVLPSLGVITPSEGARVVVASEVATRSGASGVDD
ncbi:hypothetical protein ACLOJK_040135 [Asimina triloba]